MSSILHLFLCRLRFPALALLAGLAAAASSPAAPAAPVQLPADLGEIVYRANSESPFQVFIVANSHRSPITGANGGQTVRAQIETFRIGEWLIRRNLIELLLPEGFFGRMAGVGASPRETVPADGESLESRLEDSRVFTNAELLLHRNYGIRLCQIEDRTLYLTVRELLCAGLEQGAALSPSFGRELEYLQARRSAAILQGAAAAIEAEYREGHIAAPRAMVTIGLSHLDEILRFLKNGRILIPVPAGAGEEGQVFASDLELLKKEVGVTVIVPRILVERAPSERRS
ncbi:MAG: hypothetical protein JXB25_02630 [Deltaproteobacteria bacterium]|nr:hypothetical protein [Deltaproteobacteria bacterium]